MTTKHHHHHRRFTASSFLWLALSLLFHLFRQFEVIRTRLSFLAIVYSILCLATVCLSLLNFFPNLFNDHHLHSITSPYNYPFILTHAYQTTFHHNVRNRASPPYRCSSTAPFEIPSPIQASLKVSAYPGFPICRCLEGRKVPFAGPALSHDRCRSRERRLEIGRRCQQPNRSIG